MKKYLVIKPSGGLANRLQAILGGIAFCLITERTLCVDWRDGMYSTDFSNIFTRWFDVQKVPFASVDEVLNVYESNLQSNPQKNLNLVPIFWKDYLQTPIAVEYLFENNEHMRPEGIAQSSYDLSSPLNKNTSEDTPEILVHWGYDLSTLQALAVPLGSKITCFAHKNTYEIAHILLNEYLLPRDEILQAVNAFYTEHFKTKPVGIHIRHSDLQSPLPLMLEKLQEIYKDGDEIFLCTDNEPVEKMLKRLHPMCMVRNKSFQGANIPLHSHTDGIDNTQKGFDALVEMYLLAECKDIIHYEPSSFARIAILRSNLYATGHAHCIPKQG